MSDVVRLTTLDEFTECAERGGVFVVSDDANKSGDKRVGHLRTAKKNCEHVDEATFTEKILDNAEGNGEYWWARNSTIAESELGARLCQRSARLLGRA